MSLVRTTLPHGRRGDCEASLSPGLHGSNRQAKASIHHWQFYACFLIRHKNGAYSCQMSKS